MHFPEPKNIKQLQSFLGLCNFYRKFQENYAHTTSKLSAVLQKNKQWRWGDTERNAFNEIKRKFSHRQYFLCSLKRRILWGGRLGDGIDGGSGEMREIRE